MPAALADATIRAAMATAAGRTTIAGAISAPAAITREVLKTMWFHELKMIAGGMMAGVLLTAGVVATGAARARPGATPEPSRTPPPGTGTDGRPPARDGRSEAPVAPREARRPPS